MRIVAFCGSPRKGNTEFLIKKVLEFCKESGADTEFISLSDRHIKQCLGCNSCFGSGKGCILNDDMDSLVEKIRSSDCFILGSPNYFSNVSSLMKKFIDRFNAFCKPSVLVGKKAAVICVGARSVSESEKVCSVLKEFCRVMKVGIVESMTVQAEGPEDTSGDERSLDGCRELASLIMDSA